MKTLWISIKVFLLFTFLTGIFYPLIVTLVAQVAFPFRSNGSLLIKDNRIVGSELIGQTFDSSAYFSSRPSAISYNPFPSGGSNYGYTNRKLTDLIRNRDSLFATLNMLPGNTAVPSEMVYASGSGLDPHISVSAAELQVTRIVKARKLDEVQKKELLALIRTESQGTHLGGTGYVNVLLLNLELDNQQFFRYTPTLW
jgi:K+-transporting ATPase ATPase C chain